MSGDDGHLHAEPGVWKLENPDQYVDEPELIVPLRFPRRITNVYRFPNGMVMVFDQFGEQMPEYQGRWEEKREAIERDMPQDQWVGIATWPTTP